MLKVAFSPAPNAIATPHAPPQPRTAPRYWRDPTVWLLVVGALLFRLLYNMALHPDGHPPTSFVIDENEYFGAAHTLAEGRGFSFYDTFIWVRPTLYTVLLGGLFRLYDTAYSYLPVLVVQSVLSALSLLPLGRLADLIAERRAARWTLVFGALYLPLTLFAGLLLSETLFVFFFACALLSLYKARMAFASDLTGRTGWRWVVASGVLLGASATTRGTALVFLPVAALWLALSLRLSLTLRRGLAVGGLLLAAGVATILPITVRNYAALHRLIPLDTTAGYNLWLGSLGVRDETRLRDDLLAIPDQAERQSYALQKAWETISHDPTAFLSKGLKESLDLWRPLLSAEENATKGYPSGRVPAWHLLSLLALDTILYIAILVLAIVGLAFTPPSASKWLTGLWVLLWVVMSFVFFAVTRFRLPLVVSLLPWAGIGLSLLQSRAWKSVKLALPVRLASALTLAGIVGVVAISVPMGDTLAGVRSWSAQEPYRRGEQLVAQGKLDDALASYRRADINVADTRYGLAAALLRKGDTTSALALLRPNESEDRYEPPIIRGQAARMAGDLKSARSFFNARVVQVNAIDAVDWAWYHLAPAPSDGIEIGSGLDVGYVRGFYGPEKEQGGKMYRWSADTAELRGLDGPECAMVLSGWRPGGLPPASLRLQNSPAVSNQTLITQTLNLPNTEAWTTETVPLSVDALAISTQGFVPSGSDPRLLGVRVSEVGKCRR